MAQVTQFGRDRASQLIIAKIKISKIAKVAQLGWYRACEIVRYEINLYHPAPRDSDTVPWRSGRPPICVGGPRVTICFVVQGNQRVTVLRRYAERCHTGRPVHLVSDSKPITEIM